MKTLIVTGGAGFIGSNFIQHYLEAHADTRIVNVDALTYAGNLENLSVIEGHERYRFVKADITDYEAIKKIVDEEAAWGIVNFAAESHVDRSILGAEVFIQTNINGTYVLLEAAKHTKTVERFLQVSTDEVYGSLGKTGYFTETTSLSPNSPYSSSKASADLIARSYHKTFGLPVLTTRCSNNYGPYQFPEKLIPLMIINCLNGKKLPVYGDGMNIRDWLHVRDHCEAIDIVLNKGTIGEIYNIGGNNEIPNIEIVRLIIKALGKSDDLIEFVKDRLGHDRRYAIDATKIKNELGWSPRYCFEEGMQETIDWYLKNKSWWERIISGEYEAYYATQYQG